LIEESPSPVVDVGLRRAMGEAAVQAAKTVGYRGAGTVEFLLVPDESFYFLEMNTRLQVEHPITEMVYGLDLVREQLRIAAGEPISLSDRMLSPRGHSIECRITAEDVFAGFLPATGHIEYLKAPSGPGVRWDGGIETGNEIGLFYDSLLGKLIVWGETRDRAIRRMSRALDELAIVGVPTSVPFHRRVMMESGFKAGDYDIEYIDRIGSELLIPDSDAAELERRAVAAAIAEHEIREAAYVVTRTQTRHSESAWVVAARRSGLR
jgi:acetyl-CoA carboxylase biotin carboxylase subunit